MTMVLTLPLAFLYFLMNTEIEKELIIIIQKQIFNERTLFSSRRSFLDDFGFRTVTGRTDSFFDNEFSRGSIVFANNFGLADTFLGTNLAVRTLSSLFRSGSTETGDEESLGGLK